MIITTFVPILQPWIYMSGWTFIFSITIQFAVMKEMNLCLTWAETSSFLSVTLYLHERDWLQNLSFLPAPSLFYPHLVFRLFHKRFSLVSLCWRLILILLNSGVLLFIKITLNIVFRISSWLHFPESWQSCIPPSAESQFSFNIMEFHFFVTSVCCGHLTVARYWRPTICPLFLQPLSLASCCR